MRNILVISPDCPFPPGKSGGANALYNLMRAKPEYSVDFLYYGENDPEGEAGLKSGVPAVKNIIHAKRVKNGSEIGKRVLSILSRVVYSQFQYDDKSFDIDRDYDVIVYCQLPSMQFLLNSKARNVAFPVDYMPRYFRQQRYGGVVRSLYYYIQEKYARTAFRAALQGFDSMYFVSEVDARQAAKELGDYDGRIESVGLGVEPPSDLVPHEGMGRSLVFTGVMDYPPNEDAALYLVQSVTPKLREQYGDLKLYLVGKDPTEKLQLACHGKEWVVLTGKVDSVLPYIVGGTVYVSPLRYGTGVKNKILEAMVCGAAIVASPISIEGIPGINDGCSCIVAEEHQMVDAISNLLCNEGLLARYREEAKNASARLCAWSDTWKHIVEG